MHGYAVQALLWICYERFLKTERIPRVLVRQPRLLPVAVPAPRADRRALGRVGRVGDRGVPLRAARLRPCATGCAASRPASGAVPCPPAAWAAVFVAAVAYGVADEGRFRGRAALEGRARPAEHGPVEGRRPGLRGEPRAPACGRATRRSRRTRTWTSWSGRRPPSCRPSTGTPGTARAGRATSSCATLREYLDAQTVPFLIGNDDGQLARNATGEEVRVDYNAAILFDRGRIVDTYRKLHLVPFTEHFPFERTLPGVRGVAAGRGHPLLAEGRPVDGLRGRRGEVLDADLLRGHLRLPRPRVLPPRRRGAREHHQRRVVVLGAREPCST